MASAALGIPGVNLDTFTSGITQIEISNFGNPLVGYSASQPWDRGETNINVVNNWTKISGNHTFKWGADIRRLRDDLVQAQIFGPRGHFFFTGPTTALNNGSGSSSKTGIGNDFAAFLLDAPDQIGRDISVLSHSWRETEAFFYGQDTWHITSKLTIDAGLRWELYLPATANKPGRWSNYDPTTNLLTVAGIDGNPANLGRETYYKYFAPRLGLAYRATEQTVLRAGFGISYEPFTNNNYAFNNPPAQQAEGSAQLLPTGKISSFALPTIQGQPATMANGFPAPVPLTISSSGTITGQNIQPYFTVDKHFQQPYVESWNLSLQQALPWNFVLDMAYVGNHGVKIPVQYDLNASTSPGTQPLLAQFGRTQQVNFLFKPTVSHYDSLQMKFDRKWRGGFLLTTAYTYGKEIGYRSDAGNDTGGPENGIGYFDFQKNYAVNSRNRTHTFVQSYVYELPFGKNKHFLQSGLASWIAGGWGVSGILTRMSGNPLRFTASASNLNANSGATQYPNQIAPFHVLGGIADALWFDPSSFAQPTGLGVLGNMKRFQFSGPGFFNLDAAVFRNFPIGERLGMEFRAEAFSVTNTPQFSLPNTSLTSNDFGHIRSVDGGNRSMELSAKFTF